MLKVVLYPDCAFLYFMLKIIDYCFIHRLILINVLFVDTLVRINYIDYVLMWAPTDTCIASINVIPMSDRC